MMSLAKWLGFRHPRRDRPRKPDHRGSRRIPTVAQTAIDFKMPAASEGRRAALCCIDPRSEMIEDRARTISDRSARRLPSDKSASPDSRTETPRRCRRSGPSRPRPSRRCRGPSSSPSVLPTRPAHSPILKSCVKPIASSPLVRASEMFSRLVLRRSPEPRDASRCRRGHPGCRTGLIRVLVRAGLVDLAAVPLRRLDDACRAFPVGIRLRDPEQETDQPSDEARGARTQHRYAIHAIFGVSSALRRRHAVHRGRP